MCDVAVLIEPLTIAEEALTQIWQMQQQLPWACYYQPDPEKVTKAMRPSPTLNAIIDALV